MNEDPLNQYPQVSWEQFQEESSEEEIQLVKNMSYYAIEMYQVNLSSTAVKLHIQQQLQSGDRLALYKTKLVNLLF